MKLLRILIDLTFEQHDINIKKFLEILIVNVCKNYVTFKGLMEIYFCDILTEYAHIFKNSINSSNRFDSNLERYFDTNFSQVINNADSSE